MAIQANDIDVVILEIAHALYLDVNHFYIKSFNIKTRFSAYINIRGIANELKRKFSIDLVLLLVIHAVSGCNTTSFIRSISKTNMFRPFFCYTRRYSGFNGLPLSSKYF